MQITAAILLFGASRYRETRRYRCHRGANVFRYETKMPRSSHEGDRGQEPQEHQERFINVSH